MANNTLVASDNFASGSVGSNWTAVFGDSKCNVVAGSPNVTEPNALSTLAGQIYTGVSWPNDQISEVTIHSLPAGSNTIHLTVRFQTGSFSGYVLGIQGSGGQASINRYDNGVLTTLLLLAAQTIVAGDVFTFMASGSYLIAYHNGTPIGWWSDGTYASGYPGFNQYTTTALANNQVSSWRGYNTVQQDGVWTKLGPVFPALSSDLSIDGGNGPVEMSGILYEGNAQILSGNVYKTWFSVGLSSGAEVFYAESPDAVNWTRRASAVLTNYIDPNIIKVGSTYHMYAQKIPQGTGGFDHLTSSDGVNWTVANAGVLTIGSAGAWDSSFIFSMSPVAIVNGTWYAVYSGNLTTNPGEPNSTGLATSPDGATWTKYAGNPVLPKVLMQSVQQVNGKYYAWGTTSTQTNRGQGAGYGVNPAETVRYFSTDLINWTFDCNSLHCSQMYESVNGYWGEAYPNYVLTVGNNTYAYLTSAISDGGTGAPSSKTLYQITLAKVPATLSQLVQFKEDATVQTAADGFTGGAGNLGPSWVTPTGYSALQVVSGPLVEASATSANCIQVNTAANVGKDQYSELKIGTYTNTGADSMYMIVRGSTSARTEYLAVLNQGLCTVLLIVNNVATQLSQTTVVPGANDVWRFQVIGNVLSVFQNGFLVNQAQDVNNTLTSGSPGIGIQTAVLNAMTIQRWASGNANVIPTYQTLVQAFGNPVTTPVNFGNPVTTPVNFGNPAPPSTFGNPVTTPVNFGNVMSQINGIWYCVPRSGTQN